MSAVLITAPTADIVTRAEVKLHLRVDYDDDNDIIDAMIDAAVGSIDPASGGWLGRSLRPTTWEWRDAGFDCPMIELPYPPLIEIVSFKYDDLDGVEQTLIEDIDFKVYGAGPLGRSAVAPLYGESWPSARCARDSIRIRFTAGYPAAVAADPGPEVVETLPASIKVWLKLVIGSLYANRESVVSVRDAVSALPAEITEMISTYRVFS